MAKAIITGPTGAVGIALINELIQQGIEVLAVCRPGSKRIKNISHNDFVQVVECSLEKIKALPDIVNKSYDVFYHFGWDGTSGNARNDMRIQLLNVQYALDAVEAASQLGCDTFIGAGSQAEYGRVEGILKPETPAFPENAYGIAKLCAGQMTREHAHKHGLKHIWVRILSVYGPYDGEQTMVMSTIKKLQEGITPQFTKGEQMWDYLYSGDAAEAFYLLGSRGVDGKVYVLGSGFARPLAEYIKDICCIVNKYAKIELGAIPYSKKQVMYLCADIGDLKKDIQFQPAVGFSDGIKAIINTRGMVS